MNILIFLQEFYCFVSWFYTGCNNASFYGSTCDIQCPTYCKDNTCHIQSGACFNCKPGWTDIQCNKSKNLLLFSLWYIMSLVDNLLLKYSMFNEGYWTIFIIIRKKGNYVLLEQRASLTFWRALLFNRKRKFAIISMENDLTICVNN